LTAINTAGNVQATMAPNATEYRRGIPKLWRHSSMSTETSPSPDVAEGKRKALFRHLLLPIDGSDLSRRAFRLGLELAKAFDARVLALHVVPPFNSIAYMTEFLVAAELSYSKQAVQSATRYLDEAKKLAMDARVPCECRYAFGELPHQAILEAVGEHHCDLIVMAAHGWHGLNRLMVGSETQKVLLLSEVPVLVCR
jgi:nucleotide-binding universal stress UspA family protein